MPKPFGYVTPDFLRRSAEHVSHLKAESYQLLDLQKARRVLDSGCGPGIDTVAIAKLIPESAEVIGIDIDERMITEADRHASASGVQDRVQHLLADAYDLPFEDGYFGACRAERLFQNIPASHDVEAVLEEHLRVLRPGGRIVLMDTDFTTASVDFEDAALERRMMQYCALRLRPNGLIARQFYRLLKTHGIQDVRVQAHTMTMTDPDETPFGRYLAETALKEGYLTHDEAQHWISTIDRLAQQGVFFSTLCIYIVSGAKSG